MSEMIVDVQELAQAIKSAVEETAPQKQIHISQYKAKTPYNPTGDRARVKLNCTFLQNGTKVGAHKLLIPEIELINKIKPGRYLNRMVEVIERIENGEREVELRYSNASASQRMEMKNVARNLTEMLEKIIAEQKPAPKQA